MTETRLKELQTEIAKLEKLDNKITERVAAEFDAIEEAEFSQSDESLIARHKTKLSSEFSKCDELQIPCSKDLDMEWANESI